MNSISWVCITAISIVGIVALAMIFKNTQPVLQPPSQPTGVTYQYDEQGRLVSITPVPSNVRLVPSGG